MITNYQSETDTGHRHHVICWRSALAGLAMALLTFSGVMAVSIAFGGIGLSDGTTGKNAGAFVGITMAIAVILATFVGSYYSVRVSKLVVDVVGCMQGLLVGSLLILLVLCKTLSTVGAIGQVAAGALGAGAAAAGAGVMAAGQNPMVQDVIQDSLGDAKLKSDPEVVVKNVASRLLRDDQEGAKNYLAYQTGMTPAEADQKIASAKSKIDEGLTKAREATATALKTMGWSLFVIIVLGTIASVLGGLLAAKCNERYLVDVPDSMKKARS
jgi:hypothetical protein